VEVEGLRQLSRSESAQKMTVTSSNGIAVQEHSVKVMCGWPINKAQIDIACEDFNPLDAGRYLNDTLIEFGIRYYWAKLGHSAGKTRQFGQDEIHVFTSLSVKTLYVPDKQRDENDDRENATGKLTRMSRFGSKKPSSTSSINAYCFKDLT
jgi:hypothetical protein